MNKFFDITFFKFIIVGIINTVVGATVMFICYNILDYSYWISSTLNYVVGGIISFVLNKNFTFKQKSHVDFKQVILFALIIISSYFFSYIISLNISHIFFYDYPVLIQENIALCLGMIIYTFINYLGQKLLVFTK
ncbi:GtrA family protein [Succinatimonas hippei]|uniref:GtrA family protein n=1 Tax=Succinatimonas hippei TaxID=626938 RepID=UPI003D16BF96